MWIENYLIFLLKALTVLFTAAGIMALIGRRNPSDRHSNITIEHYNTTLQDTQKRLNKTLKKKTKRSKSDAPDQPRLFVLEFKGDIKASQTQYLREEISILLTLADPEKDEVLLKLESPGGTVPGYGLAAAQLTRIKSAGLPLYVAIDQVAASGGYMMACVADHILAAPFAILGSIGVVLQMPNIHRLLKRHAVDFEQLTAGEHKRTLTLCGHNTHEGRTKAQHQLETTHALFKDMIQTHRPKIDLDTVSTGEYWHASSAQSLHLLDTLMTSDEFIFNHLNTHQIYQMTTTHKTTFIEKITQAFTKTLQYFNSKIPYSF